MPSLIRGRPGHDQLNTVIGHLEFSESLFRRIKMHMHPRLIEVILLSETLQFS
jgi:hypothetical protein